MIIEQIRYYVDGDEYDHLLQARREVTRIRQQHGVPAGLILIADPNPEDGPVVVWQCSYEDEGDMGTAEATLIGNADYEAARARLSDIVSRVELELYTPDEEEASAGEG
jgi:hypothetical protein